MKKILILLAIILTSNVFSQNFVRQSQIDPFVFKHNGNAIGAQLKLGTTDNNSIAVMVNNAVVTQFASTGILGTNNLDLRNSSSVNFFRLFFATNALPASISRTTTDNLAALVVTNNGVGSTGNIITFGALNVPLSGARITGNLFGPDGSNTNDYVTKGQTDTSLSGKSNIAGGNTLSGTQVINGNVTLGTGFSINAESIFGNAAAISTVNATALNVSSTANFAGSNPTAATGATVATGLVRKQELDAGLAAKFNIPTGLATQFVAGDGTLRMFASQNVGTIVPNNSAIVSGLGLGTALSNAQGQINALIPLTATATLDFPSTAGGATSDLTISVPGAILGKPVNLGVPNASTMTNSDFTAWVSAADVVTVRFLVTGITAKDPASGSFTVDVKK